MGWVRAGDYEVSLENGKVVCRNSAGRRLKAVPSKLRDDNAVVGLRQLVEWLDRHDRECLEAVDRWMVRSLDVPVELLRGVWPDPSWQAVLRDLVVTTDDGAVTGFLRDVDPERGIGVVDLDGDSVRANPRTVRVPHPVLLDDLDDMREFAVELGVEQKVAQLYREVWQRPETAPSPGRPVGVQEFSGGKFQQLRHLFGRAASLGYQVRAGNAVCPVLENGRIVEAQLWLGDWEPSESTETGGLDWNSDGRVLTWDQIGPVAWSEGMRMGAALYAGRVVSEESAA